MAKVSRYIVQPYYWWTCWRTLTGWGGGIRPLRHISGTKRPILIEQTPFDSSQLERSDSSKKKFGKVQKMGSQRPKVFKNFALPPNH